MKTEEKINITIDEEVEEQNNLIKEEIIELFTGDRNNSEGITSFINGFLEGFIISTNKNIQLKISLEDNPEVVLFEVVDFFGTKFIPLRVQSNDIKGDVFNYSQEKFPLNDSLKIEVKGNIDTEVKVMVRWC